RRLLLSAYLEQALTRSERDSEQDQREARQHRGGDLLAEQHSAVHDRKGGHEVRHDRELAPPEESEDPEEEQLPRERRHEDQPDEATHRLDAGHLGWGSDD